MQLPDKIEKPKGVELYDFDDYKSLRRNIYDGVSNAFAQSFPTEYGGVKITVDNLRYEGPEDFDLDQQKQAILKNRFLTRKLKGRLVMHDSETGEKLDEINTSLMRVPWLTQRNTFIHGGNEYSTIMQSRLLPGVYTRRQANGQLETQFNVRPGTGVGFRVGFEPDTAQYRLRISQANLHLYSLLKDLGVDEEDLKKRWGKDVFETNKAKYDARVFDKAYQRLVPPRQRKEDASHEEKVAAIKQAFDNANINRHVASRNLPGMLNVKRANEERAKWAGREAMYKRAAEAIDSIPFEPDFDPYETEVNRLEIDFEKQALLKYGSLVELNKELCEVVAMLEDAPEEFEKSAAEVRDSGLGGTAARMGFGGLGGLGFTALLLRALGRSTKIAPGLSRSLLHASRDSLSVLDPRTIKAMSKRLPDTAKVYQHQAESVKPIIDYVKHNGVGSTLDNLSKHWNPFRQQNRQFWKTKGSEFKDLIDTGKANYRIHEENLNDFKELYGEDPSRTVRRALAMFGGGLGIGSGAVGAETAYRAMNMPSFGGNVLMGSKSASEEPLGSLLEAKEHSDNKRYAEKSQIMALLLQANPQDFVIDQDDPNFPGITHVPTRFKMHVPRRIIPASVPVDLQFHNQTDVEPEEPTEQSELVELEKAAVMVEEDGKWVLYNKDKTRVLGTHDSREKALAQERAIYASRGRKS